MQITKQKTEISCSDDIMVCMHTVKDTRHRFLSDFSLDRVTVSWEISPLCFYLCMCYLGPTYFSPLRAKEVLLSFKRQVILGPICPQYKVKSRKF